MLKKTLEAIAKLRFCRFLGSFELFFDHLKGGNINLRIWPPFKWSKKSQNNPQNRLPSSFAAASLKRIPLARKAYIGFMSLIRYPFYLKDFFGFKSLENQGDRKFSLRLSDLWPCLLDKTSFTKFDRHYVYHTSWAARVLAKTRPESHVDISSSLYFVGILSAFVPIHFYDYRPADLQLSNLSTKHADLTKLPFDNGSIPSLSCMHVVEHVGLGRYGDPIDCKGDLKAISELKRVLAKDGDLLFVVPVGKPKIAFNAHRVYSFEQIRSYFSDLVLKEFYLIPDSNCEPLTNPLPDLVANEQYACGCFWFKKN
jgi:SAM-dependent methyltransferase